MGLVTGLLTLPLAPVRGVVWVAEVVAAVAEEEMGGAEAIRGRLLDLEDELEAGAITPAQYEEAWQALMERLIAVTDRG
jgi:hypothetical protein